MKKLHKKPKKEENFKSKKRLFFEILKQKYDENEKKNS